MKKRKLLTLSLLSVLALTACGTTDAETDAVWWNPTTWNWNWVENLNPVTWFDRAEVTSSEEEPASDSQIDVSQGKQEVIFNVSLNAFGNTNKKTVTITTNPVDAYVDLTWTVDKTEVVITKTGQKTAEIYTTDYFGGFATVTVKDEITSIQATGKVYSIGNYAQGVPGTNYESNYIDATSSYITITNTNSIVPASSSKKAFLTTPQHNTAISAVAAGYYEDGPIVSWNDMQETVFVHIKFKGSYAPMIYNMTTSTMFGGTNKTLYAKNTTGGEGNIVSIPVTLAEGENVLVLCARNHAVAVASQPNITQMGVGNSAISAFRLYRINPVTGMSFGDTTIFE